MKKIEDWIHPNIEIRNSTIEGKGMVAVAPIEAGERVLVWGGTYVHTLELPKDMLDNLLVIQWDQDVYSIEERKSEDGYFINHSCDPNTWLSSDQTIVARTDILAGAELTIDYGTFMADPEYQASWQCRCGTPTCRKNVTGHDWKDPLFQVRYRGYCSPLIDGYISGIYETT